MDSLTRLLTFLTTMIAACTLQAQTTSVAVFGITKSWKYQQTTNFDGVNWMAPAYDDSLWPSGPALLYVETNPTVTPRNTPLTLGRITYYFRTHFQFTNGTSDASLVFSNLIDDGAVFYLNGVEVQRVRMPASPPAIIYATLANALPPGSGGDATIYDVFTISGDALTNLVTGDNVLAVEVHQQSSGSSDIVWGAALTALVYTGPMTFTTQPTNTSVVDGRAVALSASAIGNPEPTYQWFKNGTLIPGATNRSYSLATAYPSNAGTYFLQASNANGTLASSNAILTVIDDFDLPLAISATGAKDLVTISIDFSEALNVGSATDTNHFAIVPDGSVSVPVQILSATITNQTNVVLVTTPRTSRADYLVHIEGVRDLSSRSNTLAVDLPLRSVVDLVTVDATLPWRFDDSGAEAPTAWAQQSFDDSGWSNGPAVLYAGTQAGQLPELARTTLALTNRADTNRVLTYYFRLHWDFPGEPATASLRLRYIVDDGAVFYLNGTEVHSIRMPATRPLFSTNLATTSIGVAVYEPATNLSGVTLSISNLSAGQNVLAVEVHQGAATSSDIALAATLEATIERFAPPVRLQIPSALSELAGVITNGGSVMLDSPLPTNLVVTLASSASNSVAIPATVLIPAGATNASFDITVLDDNLLNGSRSVIVSARAPGYSTGRATVLLSDDEVAVLTLTLPTSIVEGMSGLATISLDRALVFAAAITLVSTNPALSVPASVTVAAGTTSSVFNITAVDDTLLNGTRAATITAQHPNWSTGIAAVAILDNESTNLVLTLPVTLTEADGTRTNAGRVSLLGVPLSNVVVALQSSSPGELSIPTSVTIPAGQTNAFFDVTVFNETSTNGTRNIAITATAPGFVTTQQTLALYDDDPALVVFSHVASPQYASNSFLLNLAAADITGRLLTNFSGNFSLGASSPTGAVVVMPSSVGPFTNGRWSGGVTISSPATFVRLSCLPFSSSSDPFQVEFWPVRTNYFPSQYILHSTLTKLIYASVPSFAPGNSNSITAFDPVGGTNVWSQAVGDIARPQFQVVERPGRLAIADDGRYLFVAVSNAATVRRIDLLSHGITSSFNPGGLSVIDMAPLAGSSTSLAVAAGNMDSVGSLTVYDNGVARSNTPYFADWITSVEPGPNSSILYAYNGFRGGFEFRRLSVTASGAALTDSTSGLFNGFYRDIVQAGGLVYCPPGQVADPTNRILLATFSPGGERIAPDSALSRAFIAGYSTTNYFIQAHDTKTFLPLKKLLIPPGGGTITDLIRYGSNGLAMHTSLDFLYLIESPLLFPSGSPADLQLAQDHAPEPPLLGSNLTYTIFVTNAGPAAAFETTITDNLPTNSIFVGATLSQGFWTNEIGIIRAEAGYVPAGATVTLTVTVRPTIAGAMANRAFVVANENDTNLLNNVATDSTYVRINLAPDSYASISLTTRKLVFDSVTDRLYASIPGSVPGLGNQLIPIDPGNGLVEAGWNAGNEPDSLAIIPPGGKIYAAVNTNYLIRRINLASHGTELSFAINSNAPPADYTVEDFAVIPGTTDALGVLRLQYGFNSEIAVYDNGTPRTNVGFAGGDNYAESIEAGADGTSIYFQSYGGQGFRRYAVDAQGASQIYADTSITPFQSARHWKSVDTRLFGSDGVIIDPIAPKIIATVPGISANAVACYDAGRGRFFYLTLSNTWVLCSFDARTLAPLQTLIVTNILGTPSSLVRVRDDGFAFRTDAGQLFILRATAAGFGAVADLALGLQSSAPTVVSGSNVVITATATNRGPGSASNVVLSFSVPPGATVISASSPYSTYFNGQSGLRFDLGPLAANASINVAVTLRSDAAGTQTILAALTGNASDANQSNNIATVNVAAVFPAGWSGVNSLALGAQDLAYDRWRNRLYVSSGGDSVAIVAPDTGEILGTIPVAPVTGRLKISDNGEFLYIGVSNSLGVARVNLFTSNLDLIFGTAGEGFGSPSALKEFETLPGAPRSLVVGTGGDSSFGTVKVYDDGIPRPQQMIDSAGAAYLEFGSATNILYANGHALSGYRRYRVIQIDSNGVSEVAWNESVPTSLGDFEYAGGLLYATTGDLLAPATGAVVGHINGLGGGTLVEPDTAQNRVFFLTPGGGTVWWLLAYELGGLSPVASLSISNVFGTPVNLVRWGTNRFAFNTTSNRLYLVKEEAKLQFTSILSNVVVLAHQPLALQWQVSNAGPAATAVTVSNRVPDYASFVGGAAGNGSLYLTNGNVLWTMTNVVSNAISTATVQFLFTNNVDLLVTNQSVALTGLPDPLASNNSVTLIFPVFADNNLNGLGDTWELANFGALGVAPGADADGDGLSNQQEFLNGTDPLDASNVLRVARFTVNSNTIAITFFAARGKSYVIEKSAAVVGPWNEMQMVFGESARVTVAESATPSPIFYRIRRIP